MSKVYLTDGSGCRFDDGKAISLGMEHVGIVRHCGKRGIIIDATELLQHAFTARQAGLLYAIERDNAAPLWAATAKGLNLLEEVGEA